MLCLLDTAETSARDLVALQYVNWARAANNNVTGTADFFSNPAVIQLFEDHIRAVVNRQNTVNGLQYKNDPTIFAWDLINELRDGCNQSAPNVTCTPAFTGTVQVCRITLACAICCREPNSAAFLEDTHELSECLDQSAVQHDLQAGSVQATRTSHVFRIA